MIIMAMGNSDVQTLDDLIHYGYSSSYSVQILSLFQKEDDIIYFDKFVYQKYDKLIMAMSKIIVLTDEEFLKYRLYPERLSYDLYGTPNLSHLILYINRCADYEFKRKNIRLIPPDYISQIFQKIIEHEQKNLDKNSRSIL